MSKAIVTRLFVGSLLAIGGGFILMFVAAWLGYVNGAYVMNGPDVVGVQASGFGITMAVFGVLGMIAMAGGALGQFVAWVGAILNTAQLQDKAWFLVLLLLGLVSFGFLAMLVYLLAGPDGTASPGHIPGPAARAA